MIFLQVDQVAWQRYLTMAQSVRVDLTQLRNLNNKTDSTPHAPAPLPQGEGQGKGPNTKTCTQGTRVFLGGQTDQTEFMW